MYMHTSIRPRWAPKSLAGCAFFTLLLPQKEWAVYLGRIYGIGRISRKVTKLSILGSHMPQSLNVESLIKNSLSDVEHGRSRGKKETGQTKRREAFIPEKVFFFTDFQSSRRGDCVACQSPSFIQ